MKNSLVWMTAFFITPALFGFAPSAEAQFTYVTNNNAITITDYTGPGGVITIPAAINGYPVVSIQGAFNANQLVTSVIFQSGVTNITFASFGACLNLTNVILPNTLISIGQNAFQQTALGSVTIPASVAEIDEAAFGYCYQLQAINVDPGNTNLASQNGVVFNKGMTVLVEYPAGRLGTYSVPNSVTNIASGAFWQSLLSSVTIPAGVTGIGSDTFYACFNLTSAYIAGNAPPDTGDAFMSDPATVYYRNGSTGWSANFGSVPTALWDALFTFTTNSSAITITSYTGTNSAVSIPPGLSGYPVTDIGTNLFYSNTNLVTDITIPDGVIRIADGAFSGCSVTNVFIPESVTNFGAAVFRFCSSLESIAVDPANASYSGLNGVLFDKNLETLIEFPEGISGSYDVPAGVMAINSGALALCPNLTSVAIPASVTNIGGYAFELCGSLKSAYFAGNAPNNGTIFYGDTGAIIYYLPGTTGWGPMFGNPPFARVPTAQWNPQATAFSVAAGQLGFNITGPTNVTIVVEACTSLSNPVWLPVSTNTLDGSGMSPFSDSQSANSPERFYRFRSP